MPQYLDSENIETPDLKVQSLKHYKGFYVNVEQYKIIDDVVSKCYNSSKSIYNFRRSLMQLNENHDISFKMFLGNIERTEDDFLMTNFQRILEIRFESLGVHNTLLPM